MLMAEATGMQAARAARTTFLPVASPLCIVGQQAPAGKQPRLEAGLEDAYAYFKGRNNFRRQHSWRISRTHTV